MPHTPQRPPAPLPISNEQIQPSKIGIYNNWKIYKFSQEMLDLDSKTLI